MKHKCYLFLAQLLKSQLSTCECMPHRIIWRYFVIRSEKPWAPGIRPSFYLLKLLIKHKPEGHYSRLQGDNAVIKENLCMSWWSPVLRSPPSPPSGRVTLGETNKGRDASPFPTRRELIRATARRCGSPARTPLRLWGGQTHVQGKLRSFAAGPFTSSRTHADSMSSAHVSGH